ncbi:MAG: tRNA (5-methylaminomethyl-2-thiouridylate)-methyltransferase [Candidatus Dadabacteria bacterium]
MSTVTANYAGSHEVRTSLSAVDRVHSILHWVYGLVPIVAGADKFTDILVNWDKYLAPPVANMLPFASNTFMLIVGIIEIIAGILVLIRPRVGSIIVSLWLLGIAINLLMGGFYDIAVRDIVMSIGAYCLFTLSGKRD